MANIYFEIQADDTAHAIGFYSQIFGWRFAKAEGLPIEYWRISAGGVEAGLLQRPAPRPPSHSGTNAFVCSFEVEDYDSTEKKILQLSGIVALPKFAVPGRCWQGYYLDPEGNTFGIFEVDEEAR